MEPRKDLSWRMGKRTLSVYLPITYRGVRILAVDTRMVLGRGGARSDLCIRVPLVAFVLRLAFTPISPRCADFPGCGKCFAGLFCSPSRLAHWPVQIANRHGGAAFTPTLGASYRTAAFRPHFVEKQHTPRSRSLG